MSLFSVSPELINEFMVECRRFGIPVKQNTGILDSVLMVFIYLLKHTPIYSDK